MSSQRPAFTWTCPSCKRRVPSRIEQCHCGYNRAEALAAERAARERPGPPRPAPSGLAAGRPMKAREPRRGTLAWLPTFRGIGLRWDFWAALAVLAMSALFGLWQLLRPYQRPEVLPLLGYIDPRRPTPRPAASATPTPAASKLPGQY